jgi:tRNA-dihydrouridine synthase
MMDETGCAGVMLARGIRGAPWRIGETLDLLQGREPEPSPTLRQRLDVLKGLARGLLEYYETTSGKYYIPDTDNTGKTLREIRKFVHWFFKGYPKWLLDREGLLRLRSLDELDEFLENACYRYEGHPGPMK